VDVDMASNRLSTVDNRVLDTVSKLNPSAAFTSKIYPDRSIAVDSASSLNSDGAAVNACNPEDHADKVADSELLSASTTVDIEFIS
jgi:hypothetical protein